MRVLQINSFSSFGGPPSIVLGIHSVLRGLGHESFIAASRDKSPKEVDIIRIGNTLGNYKHALSSRFFDNQGFSSYWATKKLVKKISELNPDVIHLHNLHGYYLNIEVLFNYLTNYEKPIIWTLHDCWAFTGHCAHFDYCGCQKWKTGCNNCPQKNEYPTSLWIDNSKRNYQMKKVLFASIKDLTIVTPSKWLADLVMQSFLQRYPVKVINNGVDLEIFKPRKSSLRSKYNIENKFIILGVAAGFAEKKGLRYFIELSKRLGEEYKIILVGVDKKFQRQLPSNILSLGTILNAQELAEIYSIADVFVNPTLEEVLGLTNLESLACGTPVITFNTGGSIECIDETCGLIVEKGNIEDLQMTIEKVRQKNFETEKCLIHSQKFNKNTRYRDYIQLYTEVVRKCESYI